MKTNIDDYHSLAEFLANLENNRSIRTPLKVMGKKRPNEYHTASAFRYFYEQTPDPDEEIGVVSAPFGEITKGGTFLTSDKSYTEKISPAKDGNNHFQGDVLKFPRPSVVACSHAMILSHTCSTKNAPFILLAPIYWEKDLDIHTMNIISGSKIKSENDEKYARNLWLSNRKQNFVAFPAVSIGEDGIEDQRFVVALNLLSHSPFLEIGAFPPRLRLTFRASVYLQWRIGLLLGRDVQDSGETKDL